MSASRPLILVVDDFADNRGLFSHALQANGFEVAEAANGHEALARVELGGVSAILLDIMMPEMSGLEVLRHLRTAYTPLELPILMLTAKGHSDDVVEALGLGANDYVTKPIETAVVVARLRTQLSLQESHFAETARAAASPPPAMGSPLSEIQAAPEIGPGTVLDSRYEIENRIGSGTFGAVYRARHTELDRPVAVKLLQAGAFTSPEALARFRQEGVSACRVRHPNAVSILDFGVTPAGVAYLVMELLTGYPLEQELADSRALPVERSIRIVAAVALALAEAHKNGIVHRDIKPANIFLHQAGGAEVPKLLDFGIAQMSDAAVRERVTVEGWIVGTPVYMAPERFRNQPVDGKADVYSLAVTLYQMLTGRLPFPPDSADPMAVALRHVKTAPPPPRSVNPALTASLEAVVLRALRKKPEKRPGAAEFAAELLALLGPRRRRQADTSSGAASPPPAGATAPPKPSLTPTDILPVPHKR